jgi:hypothetical protein
MGVLGEGFTRGREGEALGGGGACGWRGMWDGDPMSTKRREFPSAGAVVSLKGSAAFWFCEISDGREGL